MIRRLAFAALTCSLALAVPVCAYAAPKILDFEDLLDPSWENGDSYYAVPFPADYAGFTWSAFVWAFDGNYWSPDYTFSRTSGRVAVQAEATASVSHADPFRFYGASFSSHAWIGQQMEVTGYLRGELIWQEVLTLNMSQGGTPTYTDGAVFYALPRLLVDHLEFRNYGGIHDPEWEDYAMDHNFAMDDFTYTTTPEPLSLTLMGTGLAGVAVARRRKREQRCKEERDRL